MDEKNRIAELETQLKGMREWSRAVIYDEQLNVIASTFPVDPQELQAFSTIFNDHDTTIANGVDFDGLHFDIHRFYPDLAFGRTDEIPLTGQGIAFCRTTSAKTKKVVQGVITYGFPTLSPRAIPMLQDLLVKSIEKYAL
eukprot:TRINITY_DN2042_c0_g1_i1.p1 TRINITY_DN2042_c0_g1~~TRINITY_DN2042_c0_g1_i1.p1  ORF type:complete len:140 (-),score=34.75 TRINITY_DN2042_c0_g1_i1:105-524(-)